MKFFEKTAISINLMNRYIKKSNKLPYEQVRIMRHSGLSDAAKKTQIRSLAKDTRTIRDVEKKKQRLDKDIVVAGRDIRKNMELRDIALEGKADKATLDRFFDLYTKYIPNKQNL